MTENQTLPSGCVNDAELAKRKAALNDAREFVDYIPDELKAQLEAGLSPEMRTAVLQLQILAIKFGRAIERRDQQGPKVVVMKKESVAELTKNLLNRSEAIHQVSSDKKVDILVAPGFLDVTKKH